MLYGNVTDVMLEHPWKACEPISTTLFGISTVSSFKQDMKAALPILTTLLGIVTEVKPVQ